MSSSFALMWTWANVVYPLRHIMLTASIYMTVSIAFERYRAVHYPLDYNLVSGIVDMERLF